MREPSGLGKKLFFKSSDKYKTQDERVATLMDTVFSCLLMQIVN